MAGLEGLDASSMEVIDALGGTRWLYDPADRLARPLFRHTDFVPVARNERAGAAAAESGTVPGSAPVHAATPAAASAASSLPLFDVPGDASGEFVRVVDRVRFGLPVGPRILTNARSDNLSSPAWRGLFGKPQHHCLTAVSYVVERHPATKAAYRIQRRDGRLLVVPGLTAKRRFTFASTGNVHDDHGHVQLTADANRHVAQVHGRFVVDLETREARDAWMAAGDPRQLLGLLKPAPEDRYAMVPIDPDVWTKRSDPTAVQPRGDPWVWQEP